MTEKREDASDHPAAPSGQRGDVSQQGFFWWEQRDAEAEVVGDAGREKRPGAGRHFASKTSLRAQDNSEW